MKLLALVTLYYPPAHITDNLLTYAEDVDGLFVWDNTPGGSNYQFPESISHKIVRLRQGETPVSAKLSMPQRCSPSTTDILTC